MNTVVNICVQVFEWMYNFVASGFMFSGFKRVLVGWYGNSMINPLGTSRLFYKKTRQFNNHQSGVRGLKLLHVLTSSPTLAIIFFIILILVAVEWYPIVALVYISLTMMKSFRYILIIHISSWRNSIQICCSFKTICCLFLFLELLMYWSINFVLCGLLRKTVCACVWD